MSHEILASYDSYPLDLPRDDLDPHDLVKYHSDLGRKAHQLFVADNSASTLEIREQIADDGDEEVTPTPRNRAGSHDRRLSAPWFVSTIEDLSDVLKKKLSPGSTRIMTIHRTNSWSRMKVTLGVFRLLCGFYQVNPRFLSFVRGMGYKSGPEDEHFMSCYNRLSTRQDGMEAMEIENFDIHYNVRYFERHGRDLEDPWSCRQSVVHQKYDFGDSISLWIVIQPPLLWSTGLEDVRYDKGAYPLALHLRFIWSAVANYREYLNYISKELLTLDQRVSIPKPFAEFDFDFSLSQSVHALRRKLHHIKIVLGGTIRTVATLSSHAEAIRVRGGISSTGYEAFVRELTCISRDLESYMSTAHEVLNLSDDIRSTINSVLEFRNQELLNKNGVQLQQIAEHDSKETKTMAEISKWTHNDSRTIRIATLIALIYLPANLVLSFFSTAFVEISPPPQRNSVADDSGGLLVHAQLWIAIVSIAVLVSGTCAVLWTWDRLGETSRPSSC